MRAADIALAVAGVIGIVVAVVHGVLTQRLFIAPYRKQGDAHVSPVVRRLFGPLLQFSTYNWTIVGVALIVAAIFGGRDVKLAVGLLAGSSYVFGAVFNGWATRGRHPGWLLYAIASVLIAYALIYAG